MPTSQALVDKMLDMAKVTPQDFVIDLGSGDGRTVITAAKRGARAMGIEYNPDMVELSKRNAAAAGLSEDKAKFMKADLFETDFTQATVITMFLLPSINLKLRPKILDMKPGTRVVSNTFTMEDWEPDETADHSGRLHQLVHGALLDRAGEGRGHVADAGAATSRSRSSSRRSPARWARRRSPTASCAATRSASPSETPTTPGTSTARR